MKKAVLGFLVIMFCFSISVYGVKTTVGPNQEILADGKPFFPIMVWLLPTKKMDDHIALGINTFSGHGANGEDPKFYLDECKKRGVYAAISADQVGEAAIKEVKDHEALLFWWMPDEPDQISEKKKGPLVSPDEIIAIYKKVKNIDKDHIVGCTFTTFQAQGSPQIKNSFFPQYMPGMDMIGFDTYPVSDDGGGDKLYKMAKGMKQLNKYDKGVKPHFVWIECTKIHDKKGRYLTPAELRAQVWMCVVHDARAIGYFTHSWDGTYTQSRIPDNIKAEMKIVNKQLTDLGAVITSATSKIEVNTDTKDECDVKTLVKEGDGKIYIFTSNVKYKKGETEFSVKGPGNGEVEVYGESRKLNMTGGKFKDKFVEFEPHIYVIKK